MLSMLSVILPRASVSAMRISEILSTDVAIKDSKETLLFIENLEILKFIELIYIQ